MSSDFNAATMQEAQDRLSQHIGPIAQVYVREAAKAASTLSEFYVQLSSYIENPDARTAFLNEFVNETTPEAVHGARDAQRTTHARWQLLGEIAMAHAAADKAWGDAFWAVVDRSVTDPADRQLLGLYVDKSSR